MSRRLNNGSIYQKNREEQYALLILKIGQFFCDSGIKKNKNITRAFWSNLAEQLNRLGPPTRNVSGWKKVWTDCRRSRVRRKDIEKTIQRLQQQKNKKGLTDLTSYCTDDQNGEIHDATSQLSFDTEILDSDSYCNDDTPAEDEHIKDEYQTDNEDNSKKNQTHSKNETHQPQRYQDDSMNFTSSYSQDIGESEEPPHIANTYRITNSGEDQRYPNIIEQQSNVLQQSLYALQTQLDLQTKMLENMSHISTTMANLMERQTLAIETQTEAIRRQAVATEHHTLVMNSFVDMIKERMPRTNSNNLNRNTNAMNTK